MFNSLTILTYILFVDAILIGLHVYRASTLNFTKENDGTVCTFHYRKHAGSFPISVNIVLFLVTVYVVGFMYMNPNY